MNRITLLLAALAALATPTAAGAATVLPSPDGRLVAYDDDLSALVVLDLEARDVWAAHVYDPGYGGVGGEVWSPDGRHLAYVLSHRGSGMGTLVIADLATRENRQIPQEADRSATPRWLPDGRLRFGSYSTESSPRGSVWTVRPDGSDLRQEVATVPAPADDQPVGPSSDPAPTADRPGPAARTPVSPSPPADAGFAPAAPAPQTAAPQLAPLTPAPVAAVTTAAVRPPRPATLTLAEARSLARRVFARRYGRSAGTTCARLSRLAAHCRVHRSVGRATVLVRRDARGVTTARLG